jgi:hypothetical protein
MVGASSRAGTMMSTSGASPGAAGGSCGEDSQNLPWTKNKYSQMSNDRTEIIAAGAEKYLK